MVLGHSKQEIEAFNTLFGLYEAIDAVKTTEPLMPSLMNALAAVRAE